MSIHKLTAGSGYDYLTRQVAALDATDKGHTGLADYYTAKGEAPGQWTGAGMTGLGGVAAGDPVTADQMQALFGLGYHPLAAQRQAAIPDDELTPVAVEASRRLGAPFKVYDNDISTFRVEVARRLESVNAADGLPRDWPVPATVRARIRTEVATEFFRAEYGRNPVDARELAGVIARHSRPRTTAVAGYDLTFSPVKSVSALWAIADPATAATIERAHAGAVQDALRFLEKHALFTRTGANGVRQVEVQGLVAAAFTHRDSRAGDPDLHTHVAVANKVQTLDGRWLSIDGRVLFKATVTASEYYNTALETRLSAALGVRFTERPDPDVRKRPVREIVGVDPRLNARWSTRRAAVETRRAELATAFQADHGRPPTPVEALHLAQRATLETREAKHEPRSLAEQRSTWRTQAGDVLGGTTGITAMLQTTLNPRPDAATPTTGRVPGGWLAETAGRVLATVQARRSTWQVWHVRAEAQRQVRTLSLPEAAVEPTVDRLTAAALARSTCLARPADGVVEPVVLRRSDGTSVYTEAGADLYTSTAVLAAEHRLVDTAGQTGGRTVSGGQVDLTLLELAANGTELNAGQASLVRSMATSGARLQLAIAPAGTGKTTAMAALTNAWTSSNGTVVGLAPSAAAAAQLREQLDGSPTDTLAKLVWSIEHNDLPDWAARIGPDTLVVVDEAGMADTLSLATVTDFVVGRGGSVRLVGDDQQLAAIGAGGVLRDIATRHGAAQLHELLRFTDPAEAAATLALRDGRPEALGFYLDHHRVHVGDLTTLTDELYDAWRTDRDNGLDAIMLAPTRDLVAELNARARTDRLTAGTANSTGDHTAPAAPPVTVGLADGNLASAGDVIITRLNQRSLRTSATDWVKNGDRWTVHAVHPDGSVTAQHLHHHRLVRLPAAYVADQVELGYATTVHAAQGVTADTMHGLLTGEEPRQQLYTMATRGRRTNHLYLQVTGDGDPHSVIRPDLIHPATPTDLLEQILARDTSPRSATTEHTDLHQPALRLGQAAARYTDALHAAAEHHAGPQLLTQLDTNAEQAVPGITTEPAWPTLRSRLVLLHADGHQPSDLLQTAVAFRELDSAGDRAAVLDRRILEPSGTGPLPWLPGIPTQLADHREWGPYLTGRAELVRDLTAQTADQAPDRPDWVPAGTTPTRRLVEQVEVWRAATQVDPADRRPTGPRQPAQAAARWQQRLDHDLAGGRTPAVAEWGPAVRGAGRSAATDPFLPILAARLAGISRAGVNAAALLNSAINLRSIPDDHGAAALWWRISRHLEPAAAHTTATADNRAAEPQWADQLEHLVGADRADRLHTSPAWPALMAVVEENLARGNRLDDLMAGPAPTDEDDEAQQLVWRLSLLLDAVPDPDGYDPGHEPPPDDLTDGIDVPDHATDSTLDPANTPQPAPEPPKPVGHDPKEPHGSAIDEVWLAVAEHLTRGPAEPSAADLRRQLDRRDAWHDAPVTRDRLLQVNQLTLDFYRDQYPGSWSRRYLTDRLGVDIAGDARFLPGHAPDQWTGLVDHLRRLHISDQEMTLAGVATIASTGRLIDRFRNRLILPIVADQEILGFVGRRHPDATGTDHAGPKYLNTAETLLYSKGAQLYGPADAAPDGATPVLVEGPVDAIAITLAGLDRYVGYAPLGTSLTSEQAHQLAQLVQPGIDPIVATDHDVAGQVAAERAYWMLAVHGLDPQNAAWRPGSDPADTLHRDGPAGLSAALRHTRPLADILVVHHRPHHDPDAAAAAEIDILAARPSRQWTGGIDRINRHHGAHPADLRRRLATQAKRWYNDPHDAAADALAQLNQVKDHLTAAAERNPATRWKVVADHLDSRLTRQSDWPALAAMIQLSHDHGNDIPQQLAALVATRYLNERPAQDLRYRLARQIENHEAPTGCQLLVGPTPPSKTAVRRPDAHEAPSVRQPSQSNPSR